MIRTLIMLTFWGLMLPFAALIFMPWTFITGDISMMYRVFMWGAAKGVRLAGVHTKVVGMEKLDRARNYIFMSNHASNIDPPLMLPILPKRTSVMVKKELFKIPLLGKAMLMGSLIPVNRGNREAGISAVRDAREVLRTQNIDMTIYIEGGRSFDGKLLPFKKGPFYLAEECQVAVVPVTISGTHYVMPKRRFSIKPGEVKVIFHHPIEPRDFGTRECLMEKVRRAIDSGLPPELQEAPSVAAKQPA